MERIRDEFYANYLPTQIHVTKNTKLYSLLLRSTEYREISQAEIT